MLSDIKPKMKLKSSANVEMKAVPQELEDSSNESESADSEEFDASDDEAVDYQEPVSKKARLDKADLYKAPTSDELNRLKETENLFQSSLFRLQITELLAEVYIKKKKKATINGFVSKLKSFMLALKPGKAHELSDSSWLDKLKVKLPLVDSPPCKGKFQFYPPKSIKEIGSYPLTICLKPQPCIDLGLEMPKECFQAKDHLNQRYFKKRALYLAMVAKKLQSCDMVDDTSFTFHHGNIMRPLLLLKPSGLFGKGFVVRLHPFPEEDVFKLGRFHIDKNNIRQRWYREHGEQTNGETEMGEHDEPATPHYNTWVLQDLARDTNQAYTEHILGYSQGVRDGITLLKVWLHQRHLNQGAGCFHGYLMTMYVVYLLAERRLNNMMSSYQIMRNTLLQLSQTDLCTKGLSLATDTECDPNRPLLVDFHKAFDVVFVDRTGYMNLCADVYKLTWEQVQHEAKLALQLLETTGIDGFDALFMTSIRFSNKFDQTFHITSSDQLESCVKRLTDKTNVMDFCGNTTMLCVPKLVSLMNRAFGRRIRSLGFQLNSQSTWPVGHPPPAADNVNLTFGLLVNTDEAYNVLEKGPSADSQEAEEFREFWGDKSELRRFQDGSICEAAVWSCKTMCDRRRILARIVKHILNRHADVPRSDVTFIAGPLDPLLRLPLKETENAIVYGTGEEQTQHVHRCYDDFAKKLRNLHGLPLTIHTIQGVSPVFRYAEVFPPLPATYVTGPKSSKLNIREPHPEKRCPPWTDVMQVLCMLETSGKWPEDKEAVQRVKAAFLLKIRELLIKEHKLVCQMAPKYLDVLSDGLVFRVEIGYQKEIALHKMITTPEGMIKMVNTESSIELEHHIVMLPMLTSMLHGLQQQHSCYSGTVRLAKRWLSSHLLLEGYMSEEAVEMIIAHLHITPAPYTEPGSPLVGFLRFLTLLCTHDWQRSPIILNLNNQLTAEDYTDVHTCFTRDRATLPHMFIASPLDKYTSRLTRGLPTHQILHRLVLLAKEALGLLHQMIHSSSAVDFKQVFRPPLDSYDVLIHLKPSQLPRHHQAVDITKDTILPPYKAYDKNSEQRCLPVVQFEPVSCYLKELRETYDEFAMFFHDTYGGSFIAVVWKLAAFSSQTFKASTVNGRQLLESSTSTDTKIGPNVETIMEGFKTIGQGLVKDIEAKTDKWTI